MGIYRLGTTRTHQVFGVPMRSHVLAQQQMERQAVSDVDCENLGSDGDVTLADATPPSIASQKRRERYSNVMTLHQQGISQREIARRFNMTRATVRRFVQAEGYPERAPRPSYSHVDPRVDYLWERWNEGCRDVKQLTKGIEERGFTASYYSVRRRVSQWRGNVDTQSKSAPIRTKKASPKQMSWMVFKDDENLTDDDRSFQAMVFEQCPEIAEGWRIASGFIALFKRRLGEDMPDWLDAAMHETVPKELQNFAKGILRDSSAILAAITLPWSNGQTEGQVNRLKTLKRQMYGRGSFDLLRLRFLSAV